VPSIKPPLFYSGVAIEGPYPPLPCLPLPLLQAFTHLLGGLQQHVEDALVANVSTAGDGDAGLGQAEGFVGRFPALPPALPAGLGGLAAFLVSA